MGSTIPRGHPETRPAAPRETPVTRVLIAEDADVVRDTLVALLELEDDLEVVAELASGDRIVPAALQHCPDVAVLDIDLPHVDGLTAAAELRRRLPACRTVILTGLAGPANLHRAVAAGASAFLAKGGPADVLIDAIRRVVRGERLIGPPDPPPG
ncbi:response regulator [Nonomuraea phyllanthi]|uniref:response regulator n=1 Tax=Nonomuraea phyllanthi TaxID=2219224 RepID=UPI001D01029E|nr:response regulator [Nonomuraea phyllanthi]